MPGRRVHGEEIVDALRVALADDRDAEHLRSGRDREHRGARAAAAEQSVARSPLNVISTSSSPPSASRPKPPPPRRRGSRTRRRAERRAGRACRRACRAVGRPNARRLKEPARRAIGRDARARARVADGEPADFAAAAHVAGSSAGGHAERARDVVEAGARIVAGQERGRVDGQVEQVAHGVRVLGAVQAMQRRRAGIRRGARGRVERFLEPAHERSTRARVGRGSPGGGIKCAAQLADRRLPDSAFAGCGSAIEPIEGEIARELRALWQPTQ